MRFNCVHTFSIEADSPQQFEERLRDYSEKVTGASRKLAIGYDQTLMFGQVAASDRPLLLSDEDPEEELETLFDG